MAYKDDTKAGVAVLKLAEAQNRLLTLLSAVLVVSDDDGDELGRVRKLITSAEQDARSVDNGALRGYEVNP